MSHLPKQVIILAGGRGTRLGAITQHIPKPMVEVNGKPFLQYLIEFLRDDGGCKQFLVLLGYLHDKVTSYFGDGSTLGVDIQYDISAVENETGERLRRAIPKVQEEFLLVYCDNYCPLPLQKMAQSYRQGNTLAQVAVYRNRDGYTRSNLRVEDGLITIYDKSRQAPKLQGVEIGFFFAKKQVLDLIPQTGNPSFEKTVFPQLIATQQLAAYETDHRYYGVGKPERLAVMREFLKPKRTIFLDRDGVLNKKAPKACYIETWQDWQWLPGAKEAVAMLKKAGYQIIIISNQAGIARGMMSHDDVRNIHENMRNDLRAVGGDIDHIYYCPHGWDEGCGCRKPDIGMFLAAQREYHLDLTKITYIGDDERDGIAAGRANCKFEMVNQERSLLDIVQQILHIEKES